MQFGESLYIDLKIKDLGKEKFLGFADVLDLEIIESAGTSLPVLYMRFVTQDKEVPEFIIPNNVVQVSLGTTKSDSDTFDVDIFCIDPPNNDASGAGTVIGFSGFIGNSRNRGQWGYRTEYMTCQRNEVYMGNSLRVAYKILNQYFNATEQSGFKSDIKKTNEAQVVWRQHLDTANNFMLELMLHMDVRPDFPLFSFNKHGEFKITTLSKALEEGPRYIFTPLPPKKTNEVQYFNNFATKSYKDMYNLYSGMNKVTEVLSSKTGITEYAVADVVPLLADTKGVTTPAQGSREIMNEIQSPNVHKTYKDVYSYNTNRLMALSSIIGEITLRGKYYRDMAPLDLVQVLTGPSKVGSTENRSGLYLIDSIVTKADFASNTIKTLVTVTRDENNNVENYILDRSKSLKVKTSLKQQLLNALSSLRAAYAVGLRCIDGSYMNRILDFATSVKTNVLRSFNIFGSTIDFNSGANLLRSLINAGNTLMNKLLSALFPKDIADIFKDFLLVDVTMKYLLMKYVDIFVPFELQGTVSSIINSLTETTSTLNSIAEDNGIQITTTFTGEKIMTLTAEEEQTQERVVDEILNDFENNMNGVDIPLPNIVLTEEEQLLPEEALRELIADKTVEKLDNLGYMKGIEGQEVKDVLLGTEDLSFNLINILNRNAGDHFYYKFWGTYDYLSELTDFFIKKTYKDKYRTLPCTKLISATKNAKIFFACPSTEKEVKFYVNSSRVELQKFQIDLGYKDIYGNTLIYDVYYTEQGYNSNSVLFEVKQGGLV